MTPKCDTNLPSKPMTRQVQWAATTALLRENRENLFFIDIFLVSCGWAETSTDACFLCCTWGTTSGVDGAEVMVDSGLL